MEHNCLSSYLLDTTLACSVLLISNPDESIEHIDMRQLKSVEFLPLARKDKANNFMLDTWRYSPFTGEKLPPIADDADPAKPVK